MTARPPPRLDEIAIGAALPMLEFEVSLTSLVAYAGATWDFHRYHYDARFVAGMGLPGPFMDGQMAGALMARQIMSWAGPDAVLRRLSYRLRNMVFAGERIRLTAAVSGVARQGGLLIAQLRLDVAKADGTQVVREATATVEIPG